MVARARQHFLHKRGNAVKRQLPRRNASTATSLAALSVTAALPPAFSAAIGQPQAGKALQVGSLEVELARPRKSPAGARPIRCAPGNPSACAIGVRMSGLPSCASTEPSTYSTIEWITLCGWITTSICSADALEQQVRLDHLQALVHQRRRVDRDLAAHHPVGMGAGLLGRHCGELIGRRRAQERPARSGEQNPAYAGTAQRPRRSRREAHWRMALCSLSIGSSCAPLSRTASRNRRPAITSASLLASSTRLPARAAARVGRQPGGTDDRCHHRIDLRERGDCLQGARARQHLGRQSGRTHLPLEQIGAARIHQHGVTWGEAAALLEQPLDLACAVKRRSRGSGRMPRHHVQRAGADRAGRTEDSELCVGGDSPLDEFIRVRDTSG